MLMYQWAILAAVASLSVVVGLSLVSSAARIESLDPSGVLLTTIIGRSVRLSWQDVARVLQYRGAGQVRFVLYLKRPRFLAIRRAYSVRVVSWDNVQQELAAQFPKYATVKKEL